MAKRRRGFKGSLRQVTYVGANFMDSLWWSILAIVGVVVSSVIWGPMGFFVSIGVIFLVCVLVWLFGDDDSAKANEDAINRGECWTNMAQVSHRNATHGDH